MLSLAFACDSTPDVGESPGGSINGNDDLGLGGEFGLGEGRRGADSCGGEDVEAAPLPAHVLLVIDRSGSMNETPEGFTMTKWETLVDSLDTALPEVEELLGLGLKLFPSGDTGTDVCSVESGVEVSVGPGPEQGPKIAEWLSSTQPGGDTPTAIALTDALEYFTAGAGKEVEGNRFVLLATDGGPNCNSAPQVDCTCDNPVGKPECGVRDQCTVNFDPDNDFCQDEANGSCCDTATLCLDDGGTKDAVSLLAQEGIKTIVLGMPGSESYTEVLDQLAVAGGLPSADESPRYNKVADPAGLTSALRSVTRNVIRSCEVELEAAPPRLDQVNVYLDGAVIPQDEDDGWIFAEGSKGKKVVITGETCNQVEKDGVEKVSVKFGCQTIIK